VHLCENVSDLSNVSTAITSGPIADALGSGKAGITLELEDEMTQCGFTAPANMDEITSWVRSARGA